MRDAEQLARAQAERAEEAEKRAKEQKEAASKLRRRAFAAAGTAAIALILLAISVVMWLGAQEQARIAETRRFAAESSSALIKYPLLSLLLAVEAVKLEQSLHGFRVVAAEKSLREALGFAGGRPIAIGEEEIGSKMAMQAELVAA